MRISYLVMGLAAAGLASCGPLPEGAGGPSFLAQNGRRVAPLSTPGQFEVVARPGDAGAQFFCAAADYAERKLNARSVDRVVLTTPVGPSTLNPGGRGAVFTVAPQGQAPERTGFTIRMNKAGENLTVGHARSLCGKDESILDR